MKYILTIGLIMSTLLTCSANNYSSTYNLPNSSDDSTTILLGSWQMDSTYFFHGDTRNGSAAFGKNVWVFKDDGTLEVHMEILEPTIGTYTFEGKKLSIVLWNTESIYNITRLDEEKLAIKVAPGSTTVLSESVFFRVEE